MKYTVRLSRSCINWDSRSNKVCSHFKKFNPKMLYGRVPMNVGQSFDRDCLFPDGGHGGNDKC